MSKCEICVYADISTYPMKCERGLKTFIIDDCPFFKINPWEFEFGEHEELRKNDIDWDYDYDFEMEDEE